MDEKQISEILECSVCLERMDQSCKVLPCQHTFCRRCLDEIVLTKHELRCPECRALVTQRVSDLPINITVVRILEGLKTQGHKVAGVNDGGKHQLAPTNKTGSSPTKQLGQSPLKTRSDARVLQSLQNHRQGQSLAQALYDYESAEKEDLNFKKGDLIQLRRQIDENWYQGEFSGKLGCFPANFVKVIIPLPQVPQSRALYDFDLKDENEKDCLSFQKDEILTVIRRVDDNWLEGRKGDKIGIFPLTFVELNDTARLLISSKTTSKTSSSTLPPVPVSVSSSLSTTLASTSAGNNHMTTAITTASTSSSSSVTSPIESQDAEFVVATSETSNLRAPSPIPLLSSGQESSTALPSAATADSLVVSISPHMVAEQCLGDSPQNKRHSYSSSPSRFSPLPTDLPSQQRHSMEVTLTVESSQNLQNSPSSSMNTAMDATVAGISLSSSSASAPADKRNEVLSSPQPSSSPANVQEDNQETALPSSSSGGQSDALQPAPLSSSPLYIAIYNYLPQKEDELELQKGDHYMVVEKCQDGWFKGSCIKTGESGVFPGNYVSIMRHTSAFKLVNPNVLNIRAKAPNSSTTSPHPTNPLISNSPHHHIVSGNSSATSTQNQGAPPLLPRVPKNNSSGQKSRQFSAPPMRSLSSPGNSSGPVPFKHSLSEVASSSASSSSSSSRTLSASSTSSHGASTSPSHWSLWASPAPPHLAQPTHTSVASIPNTSMATSHDSALTLFGASKDKDKKKKKEKEKRGLLKLLKDKKSKQTSNDADNVHPTPVAGPDTVTHIRGGSYPIEGILGTGGAGDNILGATHRKALSLDSTTPPPVPAKPRPRQLPRERYCCIVPYPPLTDYELNLELGDIIHVHRKREDGWYKGTQERTGKTGLFPASFVEKCTR